MTSRGRTAIRSRSLCVLTSTPIAGPPCLGPKVWGEITCATTPPWSALRVPWRPPNVGAQRAYLRERRLTSARPWDRSLETSGSPSGWRLASRRLHVDWPVDETIDAIAGGGSHVIYLTHGCPA